MLLKSLKIKNFRNFKDVDVNFAENLTIFAGQNASGKTNLLEALRYLTLPRSFRVNNDLFLIFWGENHARLEASFIRSEEEKQAVVFLEKKLKDNAPSYVQAVTSVYTVKKTLRLNNAPQKALKMLGEFLTVLFTPEDLNMIAASPQVRRKYLDLILCQISLPYAKNLVDLKKVLRQKNKILQAILKNRSAISVIEPWNLQLVNLGTEIIKKRREFFAFYNLLLPTFYREISGNPKDRLILEYLPKVTAENFITTLRQKLPEEIKEAQSIYGPHRDNFIFKLNGRPITESGSRGEFRSAILALKKTELAYLEKEKEEKPLLLLDDVLSELDSKRQKALLNLIKNYQTCLTTTEISAVKDILPEKCLVYEIKTGKIEPK